MNRISIACYMLLIVAFGCETENNIDAGFGPRFFLKTFGIDGNQTAVDLLVNPDGTMVVLGNSNNEKDGNQIFVIKIDSLGNTLWEKTYGLGRKDFASDIERSIDGANYVIAGYRFLDEDNQDSDCYLLELNEAGEIQNERVFGYVDKEEIVSSISILSDGTYIVTGNTNAGTEVRNAFLFKFNQDFSTTPPFDSTVLNSSGTQEFGIKVHEQPVGYYYLFSYTDYGNGDPEPDFNLTISGVSSSGGRIQNLVYLPSGEGEAGDEKLKQVSFRGDNNALIGVSESGSAKQIYLSILDISTPPSPLENFDIIKINNGGEAIVLNSLQGNFSGVSVAHTRDNNYLILANQEIIIGGVLVNQNLVLIKVTRRGDVLWEVPLGADLAETGAKVEELPGGQILVLATTSAGTNQTKITLLKLNSEGQFSE